MRLCTGSTAHRGSRGIALPFLDHGTRRGWGISVTPRPLFTPGKDPVPTVQEAGWAPRPVWTGAENLAPTAIRSPDRPARSQSLYRLSYPAHATSIRSQLNYLHHRKIHAYMRLRNRHIFWHFPHKYFIHCFFFQSRRATYSLFNLQNNIWWRSMTSTAHS